ncbi:MAG: CopG family transcriptional regulator [Alphaproteobacteria bacterium]|nr:CopG family transcriptional regulator [Alphaproteobacteria bacterium]
MSNKKIRHQFLLEPDLSEKLESLCRLPGATKTDVVAKAIRAFIDRRGETEIDQRYAKRLDNLSADLRHVRRDAEMILESLALFIRFSIALNASKPLPDKAAMAIAHERYLRFVDEIGRRMAQGKKPFAADDQKEGA